MIDENSTLALWGIYERVYSYLDVDLEGGTFRMRERSRKIDGANEARETCSIAEGWVEVLP